MVQNCDKKKPFHKKNHTTEVISFNYIKHNFTILQVGYIPKTDSSETSKTFLGILQ